MLWVKTTCNPSISLVDIDDPEILLAKCFSVTFYKATSYKEYFAPPPFAIYKTIIYKNYAYLFPGVARGPSSIASSPRKGGAPHCLRNAAITFSKHVSAELPSEKSTYACLGVRPLLQLFKSPARCSTQAPKPHKCAAPVRIMLFSVVGFE